MNEFLRHTRWRGCVKPFVGASYKADIAFHSQVGHRDVDPGPYGAVKVCQRTFHIPEHGGRLFRWFGGWRLCMEQLQDLIYHWSIIWRALR
jgi:hypothetical protein